MPRHRTIVGWTLAIAASWGVSVAAQTTESPSSGYLLPARVVVDILDARPIPEVLVSPRNDVIALIDRSSMPTIADLAQPMRRLAGVRINPMANDVQRVTGVVNSITLKRIADATEKKVTLPANAVVDAPSFSPDGTYLAFKQTTASGTAMWVAEVATGAARPVTPASLNGTTGPPCTWLDTSKALLCRFIVGSRGPAPVGSPVPPGPNIQENTGDAAPVLTYEGLLKSAYDEASFEYYFASQLTIVDVSTGAGTPIGPPGILPMAELSPNGEYLLVERVKRPFSRVVPMSGFPQSGFPRDVEIWNARTGQRVKQVADVPTAENVPTLGVIAGPRGYRWNPKEPATLVWVEALDGGDLRNAVPHRDRLMSLTAPFAAAPAEWLKLEQREAGMLWTEGGAVLVSEFNRANRMRTTWIVDSPGAAPRKLWHLSSEDRYKNPGSPWIRRVAAPGSTIGSGGEAGTAIQRGEWIYLTGSGASQNGDFPFLDRFNLRTGATERVWQCHGESYETPLALLTEDAREVLTRYESPREPPNLFVTNTSTAAKRQVTRFTDPAPQLAGVTKQLVQYPRKDGVNLSGTLYLPPHYQTGQKLPLIMWVYPREFTDPTAAGQVLGSKYRFTTYGVASHLLLLTQGYAILDDPTMPIVGPGETANDTSIEQLVASAEAAVDKVVEMGVTDREHLGVGGHSYGAFMTANLLAHTRLFKAGVARSGAYNRSLTPFGFQNERRTLWEIPQVYARMSPFWFADKVKDPILLIHGEADPNSGTYPIQSERFYLALKGHGARVRYVTLPLEPHLYAARESALHTQAEMIAWFDKWVKGSPAKPQGSR